MVSIIKPKKTEIREVTINITTGRIRAGPETTAAAIPAPPAAVVTIPAIVVIVAAALAEASASILSAATDLISAPIPLPAI